MPVPVPIGFGSTTITSKRGRIIQVRHVRPEDAAALIDLYERLSPETRRLRFHLPTPNYPAERIQREAERAADLNPRWADALVAIVTEEQAERVIAFTQLAVDREDATIVEGAIVVRDDYQNEGIGSILFDLLVQIAIVRGHTTMRAYALAENEAVHKLIRRLGLPYTSNTSQGETTMMISLSM
jgi:acetyltransferase